MGLSSVKRTSQYSRGSRQRLAAADAAGCGRRQLARLLEDGARLGHVAQREVLFHRQRVDVAPQAAMGQQRLQFGAEQQRAVVQQRVVHGLDAQAVARHEEGLRLRSHSAKANMPRKRLTQSSPQDSQACTMTLGVALGVEHMAQGLQFGDQFLVVVDLAVEDDDHRAVFVEQRLLAGGDVDDGQAPVAQPTPGSMCRLPSSGRGAVCESFMRCSTACAMGRCRGCRRCR
jgi:hypothetical protein